MDNPPLTDNNDNTADERREKPSVHQNLLVAAIDFGTAYSGYAFLSREKYEKDPLSIKIPEWDENKELTSYKTPTSILFDKNGEFDKFGNEAERKFKESSENDNEKGSEMYFFQKFKMLLFDPCEDEKIDKLNKNSMLRDIIGKEMPAIKVFSEAIKYLKNHLLKELEKRDEEKEISEDCIGWVLTVPAIWSDAAKQFMRDAAKMAGIRRITIALEPEAASIYIMHLPIEQINPKRQKTARSGKDIQRFRPGSQYLVMDAGGGTVDITIHKILDDGKIEEEIKATGGAWGGTYVDDQFHKMLETIIGKDVFEEYKKENISDYMDMRRTLEIGKRNFSTNSSTLQFKIPASLQHKCKEAKKCSLEKLLENSNFRGHLTCKKENLNLGLDAAKNLFSTVCNGIVKCVEPLVQKKSISTILMVGGFSESSFLQETMMEKFPSPDYDVVIPPEAGLAVLKGAVLFGHEPKAITSRKARYTYGVETYTKFKPGIHPDEKIAVISDKEYCSHIFSKHITKGDTLKIDEAQESQLYSPIQEDQKSIRFKVYTSTKEDPKYVDEEGCRYVASLNIDIPDTTGGTERQVLVNFMFGNTEIKVEGANINTPQEKKHIPLKYFEEDQDDNKQYAWC